MVMLPLAPNRQAEVAPVPHLGTLAIESVSAAVLARKAVMTTFGRTGQFVPGGRTLLSRLKGGTAGGRE